ncbi:hypothetical protein EXU34_21645 [Alteromonas sp. ZYF713]|nr:hypothetical protein [Alteromonas sp. ZYF713]
MISFTTVLRAIIFPTLLTVVSVTASADPVSVIENWLKKSEDKSHWQKVKYINNSVNKAAKQTTDIEIWHQVDYWASPIEMLSKGAADCEDFATTKYLLLKQAGISPANLYLSHVKLDGESEPHMVLVYHNPDDSGFYVLDNVVDKVKLSDTRTDLKYTYSFNEKGIFTGIPGAFAIVPGSSPLQLKRWQSLLNKWSSEKTLLQVY